MNTRSNQDNDITLYSFAEIETMMRILDNPNSKTHVPFSHSEIMAELLRRQKQ